MKMFGTVSCSQNGYQDVAINSEWLQTDRLPCRSVLTSRLLLSESEFAMLSTLDRDHLRKTRHYHHYRGRVFSIDVFAGELAGLILCSVEVEGLEAVMTAEPPPYVQREVTEDEFFTGGNLCRITRGELVRKLSSNSGFSWLT